MASGIGPSNMTLEHYIIGALAYWLASAYLTGTLVYYAEGPGKTMPRDKLKNTLLYCWSVPPVALFFLIAESAMWWGRTMVELWRRYGPDRAIEKEDL